MSATIIYIIAGYAAIILIAYLVQEKLIFKPEKLPQNFEYKYDAPFEELFFDIAPGVRINGLHFYVPEPKGLILYFHGNSRSIKGWAKYARDFYRYQYDVVLVDYRGFGKSTGKRSEKDMLADMQYVYDHLKNKYAEDHILVYGRSLGSGFATKVAADNNPRYLILDAPYFSFLRVAKRYTPFIPHKLTLRFKLQTDQWIKKVKCHTYIIHGTKDWLIPIKHSQSLRAFNPHKITLIAIHGGGHNNLPSFPEYHKFHPGYIEVLTKTYLYQVKKKLLPVLKIVLILYALIGIFFYAFQQKFLFQATPIASDSAYTFSTPFKEQYIPFDAATKLDIIQFQSIDTPKGIVLYFHGNRDNIGHYAKFAPIFTNNRYETWMIDYPGYGKSTGELTEDGLYELALQLYKLARKKYAPNQIIIYGKSIGTGIATQLASIRDCKQLILETPYYSIPSMLHTYFWMYPLQQLLHYKLPTYAYLPKVTAPVTIFHGTADELIDYKNALQLKKFLKPSDQFITIEGGKHNNLNEFPLMQVKLKDLLNK